MKYLFFTTLFVAVVAKGQTVTCVPHGDSELVKVELTKPDYNFDVPWYTAKVTNKYRQVKNFIVKPTSRRDHLLFISQFDRAEFSLDIGKFQGQTVYHGSKLELHKRNVNQAAFTLMCTVKEDVDFRNICQKSVGSGPQDILFQAAKLKDLDLMEAALACGVDIEAKDKNGCTSLLLVADPLCGKKDQLPFYNSPDLKNFQMTDLLINNGAMLEEKDPLSGEKALHKFTKVGDFESVDLLLSLEADVNSQDNLGYTPLMRAVENNDKHMVLMILEANPDVELKNKKGLTALSIAKSLKYKKLEIYLEKPSSVIEIFGKEDGLCAFETINIPLGKVSRFVLKASDNKMFLMTAPDLGLSVMAYQGQIASQNIVPTKKGEFEFSCGIHGGLSQTTGKIRVE